MAESASESRNVDVDEKLELFQNDPGPYLKLKEFYWKHNKKKRSKVVSVDDEGEGEVEGEGEGQGKGYEDEKGLDDDENPEGTEKYESGDHEEEDQCVEGNCRARRAELEGEEEWEEVEKHEGEDQEGGNDPWEDQEGENDPWEEEEECHDLGWERLKWKQCLKEARKKSLPDYLQESPCEKKKKQSADVPAEEDVPPCIKEILFCSKSMNVCQRQISCRHLLDMLRTLHKTPEYVEQLFQIIDNLSDDREACVVAELIEHVLPIARFCYENEHLRYLIADRLVPLVLRFLMAPDPQVRGNTQECLRILRLEELIDQEFVKRFICPVLINLTYSSESSPEYYSHAITLMTKMLPVIGREATEEFFVPRIISLSMDSVMMVRKMCVANFGEYCSAVSTQVTENVLLPYFIRSCYDCTWEVRKSCAEVIMSVSCACRLETRKSTLAPVCAALLSDNNRAVRMAAFETLGPFITTFAEPSITGLAYNQHGQLVLTNWSGFEFRTTPKDDERCRMLEEISDELNNDYSPSLVDLIENNDNNSSSNITTNHFRDVVLEDYSDSNNSGSDVTCTFENSKLRSIDDEESNREVDQLSNDLGAAKLFSEFVSENDSLSVNNLSNQNSEQICNSNETTPSCKCDTPAFENSELSEENSVENNVDENTVVPENRNSLNVNKNESDNINYIVNNYNKNNNNNSYYSDNFTNNTTVIDDNDNELGLQQYNTFLYWRDPLPVLDDLELSIPVSNCGRSFDNSFLTSSSSSSSSSCSSSSISDDENKNNFTANQDRANDSNSQTNNINSNVPSNSSTISSVNKNNSNESSIGVKKIPVMKGSGNKDDASQPMMEMLMRQMYDRLYSELNNDITYKPIPVLPFSDSAAVRQNLGLYKGLGLCRKKPCEKPRQNIVPQELIDHFVSLSDPVQGNRVDNRFLVYQIAYSLPAVAQTLGKENWPMLKNVYEKLAADKTWKVRRAVASSIHELAAIVGQDAATQDLIPVFNNIIKDLDEVRIGALKHLASFLKTLRPSGRNSFLPKLSEFLMMDCDVNWRFREELAEQLLQMVGMFSTADTYTHLVPLAILLLLDKVAAVRQVALSLVTELVRWISSDVRLLHSILVELAEQFAHSTRWNRRQTFALLCSKLVCQNVLPDESFAVNVLPHLLDLSWDSVPNVRLAVARTLSADIAHHSYYADPQSPHHEVVMQTLRRLQADRDRDVQYLAFSGPTSVYCYKMALLKNKHDEC